MPLENFGAQITQVAISWFLNKVLLGSLIHNKYNKSFFQNASKFKISCLKQHYIALRKKKQSARGKQSITVNVDVIFTVTCVNTT